MTSLSSKKMTHFVDNQTMYFNLISIHYSHLVLHFITFKCTTSHCTIYCLTHSAETLSSIHVAKLSSFWMTRLSSKRMTHFAVNQIMHFNLISIHYSHLQLYVTPAIRVPHAVTRLTVYRVPEVLIRSRGLYILDIQENLK